MPIHGGSRAAANRTDRAGQGSVSGQVPTEPTGHLPENCAVLT
jgi:hypothetical protein